MKLQLLKKRETPNMLEGSPIKCMLTFGIPIMLGSIFQQFYSMVDSIVVGKFVSAAALAAVGSSSTICHCLLMACAGFTMGASVIISQQFGAGKRDEIKTTISTTLIFLVITAIILSFIGIPLATPIAKLINVPDDILDDSVTYMTIYWAGLVFLMLYNFFASVMRALGDSITPLIFLIVSSLLNIVGDLYFVIGLNLRVAGVAWATVLSQAVSVILCIFYVRKKSEYFHFKKGEFRFSKTVFGSVLRMGIPAALQGSIMNMSFLFVQRLVNSFSTVNIAAYTAAGKMESLSMLPIHGITEAYAVFVGQNMGAGNIKRTKEGLRKAIVFLVGLSFVCAAIIYAVGPSLIGMFVDKSEVEVITNGTRYLRVYSPFLVIHAFMSIFGSLLRGSGDSFWVMIASFADLGMRLAAAYTFCLACGMGFIGCSWAIPVGWLSSCIIAFIRYRSGKWQEMTFAKREARANAKT